MAKRTRLTSPRGAAPATIADLPQEDRERIKRYQASAQAKNTSAAYGAQLRLFKVWCKHRSYADAPPVAPAIVATWLLERADAGAARSTLTVALAAIKFGHKIAGQAMPWANAAWDRESAASPITHRMAAIDAA